MFNIVWKEQKTIDLILKENVNANFLVVKTCLIFCSLFFRAW